MNEIREFIKKNIATTALTVKEQKVLDFRYGLTDNTTHTLEEVGKLFGVTRERIRQIEAKCLDKMRGGENK